MSTALLDVSNLTSGYRTVKIVKNITFSVAEGEILAIIGRNGVGKTTLLRTLIGSLGAFEGRIQYKGNDITGLRPCKRAERGIGYVPQGRGIFSRMTVAENLNLGQGVGACDGHLNYDRVYQFFPILKQRSSQKAGLLSGGEQQQLALGRVLVGNPELILLDEPSEGVQPNLVRDIGRIVRRLKEEEKLTVVIVEQNLDLIRIVADRCIVVDKGTVVAHLSPQEIVEPATAKRYLAI